MSLFRLESGRLMDCRDIEKIEHFGRLSRGFNSCVTLKSGEMLFLDETDEEIVAAARRHGVIVELYMPTWKVGL